jgi:predicted O-linked N-acetylglucosamine transferase (SPINDLY family)
MSAGEHAAPISRKGLDAAGLFAEAQAYHRSGRLADAQTWYKRVLKKRPNHFGALHLLGLCEYQAGNHDAAARLVKRALLVDPQSAAALSDLGVVFSVLQRRDEALACFDRLIGQQPGFANAYFNRGKTLLEMGRFAEAIASFDKEIEINPDHASSFSNRGNALYELGRFADAVESYDQAIEIAPDHTGALTNRGEMLLHLRQPERALASFDRALSISPGLPEAWLGYSIASLMIEKVPQALAACQRALAIKPQSARAFAQLGECHALMGDADVAVSYFDRALAIEPDHDGALSSRIFSLDFTADSGFAEHQAARSEWWRQIGAKIAAEHHSPHENDRTPNRRIVLGYVSAEFRGRSAAFAYRPVLQNHDKSRFEVICYSNYPTEDAVTASFRQVADRWRSVYGWSDEQLADCIRADKVDILIDLNGHSEGKRLHLFARKPAPVQVTAWGHATGTGLPTIDYLFSDPVLIPAEVRHLYAEQVYDLPCALIIEPPPVELICKEPPVTSNGYLTYGVFNRISKLSNAAISVWCRILRADGTARLLIKHHLIDDDSVRSKLQDKFTAGGIALDRLCLLGSTSRVQHLAAYGQVDICLDPFPNGGGVSTWEALYMGVPVVAKLGNGVANRVAGAILSAIGMSDWVAADDDQYMELALRQTPERLRTIRHELHDLAQRRCGPAAYTRAVEEAYRTMWEKVCGQAS